MRGKPATRVLLLSPQQTIAPSFLRAQASLDPTRISTASETLGTATGAVVHGKLEPFTVGLGQVGASVPRRRLSAAPQHQTVPSLFSAHVLSAPARRSLTLSSPGTGL